MKEREEYLINYENKLIEAITNGFKSIDKLFARIYILTFIIFLFGWGSIEKISFFGASIIVNTSTLYLFTPIIVSGIYVLINYNLLRIAGITQEISINSEEIVKINPKSRPITLRDMRHFEQGITGLIMSLARWQASKLIISESNKPQDKLKISFKTFILRTLRFFIRVTFWGINLIIRPFFILVVFYLPLIAFLYYLLSNYELILLIPFLVMLLLVSMAIITTIIGFLLFSIHFIEMIRLIKQDIYDRIMDVSDAARELSIGEKISQILMRVVLNVFSDVISTVIR